ncbi:rhodanese-like domain-containing protein [Candidatus Dojkabacteria bacterium]|nr:rhodanese-like domain-containing protein [Candidatus Dojkabacteria bacterium]
MKKVIIIVVVLLVVGFAVFYVLQQQKEEEQSDTKTTQNQETQEEESEDTTTDGYMDVSAKEAEDLIQDNPDLIIIDVSPNYDEGHLPGAVNYYVGDGSLDRAIPTLDKNSKYLVYCHVDSASISGANILISAGFTNVYRLEGNYQAWVDAGYDIEK